MRATQTFDRSRVVTWANGLTLARLASAPALAVALVAQAPWPAALLFVFAVVSDFADGAVARRRGDSSALGGVLDHAADAAFVTFGLGALAHAGAVPAVLPPLIFLAFAQYALDSRALAGSVLRPSSLGRWNGISYYVLLGIPVLRDALGLPFPPAGFVRLLGWLLVASTLVSIADRARALFFPRRGERVG